MSYDANMENNMHHCHWGSHHRGSRGRGEDHEIEGYFWMGRHGHGHGRGRGRGGFGGRGFGGGPGFDDDDFRRGRKLGAEGLQLLLLQLLTEKASHGYELIKALEERSSGYYVPSPGMVYPALTYLEELGYARVEAEGAKKLYHPTEEGRRHLDENRAHVEAILEQLERIGRKMARMREAYAEGEDEEPEEGSGREVWLARRELKQALREMRGASAEEVRRVADILRRAAAEILGRRRDER
jgi:DNA-binding PadR family transcriptional regulator